mgnify:CR=1 FL=1
MPSESTTELKEEIDAMTHYEMARLWRFSPSGNPMFEGDVGEYFKDRLFKHFGGFTPGISKSLGW